MKINITRDRLIRLHKTIAKLIVGMALILTVLYILEPEAMTGRFGAQDEKQEHQDDLTNDTALIIGLSEMESPKAMATNFNGGKTLSMAMYRKGRVVVMTNECDLLAERLRTHGAVQCFDTRDSNGEIEKRRQLVFDKTENVRKLQQ